MDGSKLCYIYFILSQAIWGVLPAFWLLLRQLPPLYTLASRIVWASVFCFFLIIQKKLLPDLKGVRQERWQWPYIAGAGLVLAFCLYGVVPWLSFLICLTWATYSMLKKKVRLDSQVSVFIESFSMVPLSLLFIAFSEGHGLGAIGTFQGWQWLLLPATGVVTAVPMMLFSAGVKGVPITTGGMLMYLSPSITLVIGLLSGETITPPLRLTFCFAWVAVALYMYAFTRQSRGFVKVNAIKHTPVPELRCRGSWRARSGICVISRLVC